MMSKDEIFIIDAWIDTESKENDLIGLIKILKEFDIPILLSGHYPIKVEIQKMVDYYIFDKENPIITKDEYDKYDVHSERWTHFSDCKIINKNTFHHDYAVWSTMRNSFNFAKYLGKKQIHFLEYDNLPNPFQYKQAFIEYSKTYDAVIYEYNKNSVIEEYCGTFIFSIKTDVAINLINKIKSKEEYYINRHDGWQLERLFLKYLKEVTNSIFVSKYIPNDNELNTQAVWDRDGIFRNGAKFQIFLACDNNKNLYVHFISGFADIKAEKDYLVEVNYGQYKSFHTIIKDDLSYHKIGEYRKGDRVKIYYQGVEVFNNFLEIGRAHV
jgi:hypothetical protein